MQISSLIGRKLDQTQGFLEDGTRVPLSIINVGGNIISQVKTSDKDGYDALQLGFDIAKRANKPAAGHSKKAGLEKTPRFFREVKADEIADATPGTAVVITEVFEPGDIVDVVGTSKGKGYAGVVKRHGFHGGPRTHGQSDRERAPGSSGQTTTPGRVYRGKRMSGRMGNEQVTVKNLEVLEVREDTLLVRGLIPGIKGGIVVIKKVGKKNKSFMPLWSEKPEVEEATETAPTEVETASDTIATPQNTVTTPEEKVETAQEEVKTAEETVKAEPEDVAEEKKTSQVSETLEQETEKQEEEENAGK